MQWRRRYRPEPDETERELTEAEIAKIQAVCKRIPEYPDYWVNQDGTKVYYLGIRRSIRGFVVFPRLMPQHLNKTGYLMTHLAIWDAPVGDDMYRDLPLYAESKYKHVGVHVLVAMAWIGPRTNDQPIVRHLDGIGTNNHYGNLKWSTDKDNGLDRKWHRIVGTGKKISIRPDGDINIAIAAYLAAKEVKNSARRLASRTRKEALSSLNAPSAI